MTLCDCPHCPCTYDWGSVAEWAALLAPYAGMLLRKLHVRLRQKKSPHDYAPKHRRED